MEPEQSQETQPNFKKFYPTKILGWFFALVAAVFLISLGLLIILNLLNKTTLKEQSNAQPSTATPPPLELTPQPTFPTSPQTPESKFNISPKL